MKKTARQISTFLLATTIVSSTTAFATNTQVNNSPITPQAGSYGYFVDNYKTNTSDNKTPESNAVIGLLSGMSSLWQQGDSWNNGKILGDSGKAVLDANIQKCVEITNNRTEEQGKNAYLIDRRNQNYSALNGLGIYADSFKTLAHAATTIDDEIPDNAETTKYDDKGNSSGNWANEDSSIGDIVKLVNTLRGNYASSNPSKYYFQYMRPFRWSSDVSVYPSLKPCIGSEPEKDGGFPSGHTNAGYLASFALAYAVPERFQQCLTNASEIGNSRIVAGMHSPLDVIGGRIMATALAAATLNDKDNEQLKNMAYDEAQKVLLQAPADESKDTYTNHAENKATYEKYLTYGLPQTGDTTKPMVVPKGAEVLLETRFPYLDAEQRRWVLYSTGLPSGYEFLDDTEGWGRLNLFSASDGYGSFDNDVTVTMDSSKGGFNAKDTWRNDISGNGGLYKKGDGELTLTGNNTYTGGTNVEQGTIVLAGANSAGNGVTNVDNGTLEETVAGTVKINNDYTQSQNGCLVLNVSGLSDVFDINGTANIDGTLKVNVSSFDIPQNELQILKADSINGNFDKIEVSGLSDNMQVVVKENGVFIQHK